ncbi:site-specific DNA-methyltransferase [Salinibacterium sp. ZJ450]|uniref:DNA-methyltransferase n=1 Tax=Salinibacterium sp. ZJ450 TaxID=2708338 RepID=UPI00142470C8|nr:site-specific DNA-methyltransferase [Salinibacterium sp. ZJ450]
MSIAVDHPPEERKSNAPLNRNWEIRQGDAWDLSQEVQEDSVDLVLTSPPYWGLRSYGHEHNDEVLKEWVSTGADGVTPPGYEWYRAHGGVLGLEPYPSWFIDHLVSLFDRLEPALRASGSIWVNLGDTYFGRWSSIRDEGRQGLHEGERRRRRTPTGGALHDKQLLMIPARFAIAMQDAGWILRNDLVWSKPHMAPRPEKDRLKLSHEHLFHFVKRNPKGRPTYFYDLDGAEQGGLDVISVRPDRSETGHSATFPVKLVAPRIRSSSPPGGVVLDPFSGSGSTLVAAVSSGRDAIGFELSQQFATDAASRMAKFVSEHLKKDTVTDL